MTAALDLARREYTAGSGAIACGIAIRRTWRSPDGNGGRFRLR